MRVKIDGGLWERLRSFGKKPVRKASWFEQLSNKARSEKERSMLPLLPEHEHAWLERHKFFPTSFVLYQLASKSPSERAKFLSDGHGYVKLQGINGGVTAAFLWNKLVFQRVLEMAVPDISFPKLRGLIRNKRLTSASPPYEVTTLETIFEDTQEVVVKPIESARGHKVQFLTKEDIITRTRREITKIIPASVDSNLIVVDRIHQAPYASQISPASSNTVRIVGMRRPLSREVFVPFAVHRFGTRDTAPLDNFSKGGLSCAIDVNTGELGPGVMHPSRTKFTLSWHPSHPDTGQTIEGVVIPHWQKLLEGVTQLMDVFPDLEFVGWDMLPIKDGWCVIEGNAYMDIDLLQAHGGMLADHRVKEFFEYHCL